MQPLLILDAYLDELGGARNLLPRLVGLPTEVVRVAHGEPPPPSAEPFAGILVTGSAASILDRPAWLDATTALVCDALRRRTPFLGLCFGHQLLAHAMEPDGGVVRSPRPEFGWIRVERTHEHPLLGGLPATFTAFASHRDEVPSKLSGTTVFARSEDCEVQAFQVTGAPQFGVQFHPEMSLDEARALVRERLGEPAATERLKGAADTSELGDRVVASFLALAARR